VFTDTLGVGHVNSIAAALRIGPREVTQTPQTTQQNLMDIVVDVLRRILRFFFGFSIIVFAKESWV
jgi:hypothetical protein